MLLLIVGTFHHVHVRQKNSVQQELAGFEAILRRAIETNRPSALVEEMSYEAMETMGGTSTLLAELALEFKLPHVMCDPDDKTRRELKIESKWQLLQQARAEYIPDSEIERRAERGDRRRERYWLDRIAELRVERVLFVCGRDHVDTFCDLAQSAKHVSKVLIREWPTDTY